MSADIAAIKMGTLRLFILKSAAGNTCSADSSLSSAQ